MKNAYMTIGIASVVALLTLAAACSDSPTGNGLDPAVNRDLAKLRKVTDPLSSFDAGSNAGWSAKITGCMTDPTLGGMGYHYGKTALIDGSVKVDEPELLLYVPQQNGQMKLVAVEYIIPYTFHAREAEAPVLFGQQFKQNDTFQLWGLHAWVGQDNPSGIFASWNPQVNCQYANDAMTMVH